MAQDQATTGESGGTVQQDQQTLGDGIFGRKGEQNTFSKNISPHQSTGRVRRRQDAPTAVARDSASLRCAARLNTH